MAAKPIERFVKRQIQDQGGWPRILERIASGETVADVARSLKRPDGLEVSRSFFSRLLHDDQERSQAVAKARAEGADAMVDHGLHLVDTAQTDRDSINKAKVQAELRLKVAGFVNREQWGESKQAVNVTVNAASLHVDALRHRIVEANRPMPECLQPGVDPLTLPPIGYTLGAVGSALDSGDEPPLTRGTVSTHSQETVEVTVEPSNSAA